MIESFLTYIRTLHFTGPEIERRYFRLFGDLEYDLLSLRVEITVMEQRLREVQRRIATTVQISSDDEREICSTSHEINEHLYGRLERLHARIAATRGFRYDHGAERHCYFLLRDVALAVLGIRDDALRARNLGLVDEACRAYARLDDAGLFDIHESVQELLALERRNDLSEEEDARWNERLRAVEERHPLRYAEILETPERISRHIDVLRRTVARAQARLEQRGMIYAGIMRTLRFRN